MKHHGLGKQRRPRRHELEEGFAQRERRSYEVTHVHGLWHCDFHKTPRKVVAASGKLLKATLFGVLDDRSRLCCHAQWYLDVENPETFVHGISQAFQKRGLPRSLMSDNGGAMLAAECEAGLERLSVLHPKTLSQSPEQNGKQEVFWAQVEGRLMAMLEGEPELTLELLNRATQAWVELRRLFRQETTRQQRRGDGTISVAGVRFEVPSAYRTLLRPTVRFARWDLSSIELVDPRKGTHLATLYPLDKEKNAERLRREVAAPTPDRPALPAKPSGIAPLLRQLMADYAATGLPPAYVPRDPTVSLPAQEREVGSDE